MPDPKNRKISITFSYDGSKFHGFAANFPGDFSVQSKISRALKSLQITGPFVAAGRTDRGVHALNQVISLEIPPFWEPERLKNALQNQLDPEIFIKKIDFRPPNFHARFSAKRRIYRYLAQNVAYEKPKNFNFLAPYISRVVILDVSSFIFAMRLFIGRHNFSHFSKRSGHLNTFREIFAISVRQKIIFNREILVITIAGNAFLHSQIRLMIGAAIAFSAGKISKNAFFSQLRAKSRTPFMPAPPNGLYLSRVIY